MSNQNNSQEVPQVKSVECDTPKCKCGGRTALVSGYWYYSPDSEPYNNGVQEKAEIGDSEAWMNGFVCDDCGAIQDVFVDEKHYKSRIAELEKKNQNQAEIITNFKKEIIALKAERDKLREALTALKTYLSTKTVEGFEAYTIVEKVLKQKS